MGGSVRFLLNGTPRDLGSVPPNTSVLQYLRDEEGLYGAKDGCGSGGCGACTVALAEPVGDRLRYRSVNACNLPLTELHGKLVVTVEGLTSDAKALHPVQRAVLDHHATQCGYCTPGVVMSLFALLHRPDGPPQDDTAIREAIDGNLCRCTGYRPIIAAARSLAQAEPDGYVDSESMLRDRLRDHVGDEPLVIETAAWRFVAPHTLKDVFATLEGNPDARIVCGGTASPPVDTTKVDGKPLTISLAAVGELSRIEKAEDNLIVGAAVPYADMLPVMDETHPALAGVIRRLGAPQTRHRGTLGGALGQSSPNGDAVPGMIALGAAAVLCSAGGERTVPIANYLAEEGERCRTGEIIGRIEIPLLTADTEFRTYKLANRHSLALPVMTAAFWLHSEDGVVSAARIAYSGLGSTVRRLPGLEDILIGQSMPADLDMAAQSRATDAVAAVGDEHTVPSYQRTLAVNLLRRFVIEVNQGRDITQVASL